jgi:chorismate synthase
MTGNNFGSIFSITTYGESHGKSVGVIIDGCPPGIELSEADIQPELDRRRPGQSALTTPRNEADSVEIHSGLYEGVTTGTPILLLVKNADQRSQDYAALEALYRPSHADYTYSKKYGVRDPRGGGRSSARETLARVAAGAVAKKVLTHISSISVVAYVDQVYTVTAQVADPLAVTRADVDYFSVRCPDATSAEAMSALILEAKEQGDSLGGIVRCIAQGLPVGLGEPVFDKLPAELGKAMLSINAVKGFELGSGFSCVNYKGSEHNDELLSADGAVSFSSNRAGGTLGGISNGDPLDFRVAFKPTATILKQQNTVTTSGESVQYTAEGRHDPCVLPRAVPIVEAMTWLVLADLYLRQNSYSFP